ncbi:prepilin peptidase [Herbiconiux sp.]|uniref:prepilin peptidase n=1 Tax=Herbiconiux sp. TaxID=1871186 RepID=UPI0025BCBED7|nr:prepilin peptidase [Herbiconiux sp.]
MVSPPPATALLIYLAAVSLPLALADLSARVLPNRLTIPGLVLLLATVAAVPGRSAASSLAAAGVAATVFGAVWAAGAVGMGDVKLATLLAGTAALTDARALPTAALAFALLGGTQAALALAHRHLRHSSGRGPGIGIASGSGPGQPARSPPLHGTFAPHQPGIPLGPPLLAAFWVGVLLR